MENAGQAAAQVLARELGIRGRRFPVVCGVGNNGGDGLVVARKLCSDGGRPTVFLLGNPERFRGAAQTNWRILQKLPIPVHRVAAAEELRTPIVHADAVVDALLGTGLDREVEGLFREVIALLNADARKVLSLDIPSGIHGDTGEVLGEAVRATWTVTFGLPKAGNLLPPGCEYGGRLYVCHISFPPELQAREDLAMEINEPPPLPPRPRTAHKGSMGDVLVIAGAASYFGAPRLAALSFLRAGGGYARLAAPASMVPSLACGAGEVVFVPQAETRDGSIARSNRERLLALAAQVDFVILGPGLSLQEETRGLVRDLAHAIAKPLLLDGDGLTSVAEAPSLLAERPGPTILTPHPGEMARLTGQTVREVERQRVDLLRSASSRFKAVVVLKGARSLIGLPDKCVYVNLTGNPGMATAGAGDVLTGTIAAMYGQGLPVAEAACKGVFLHGLAGDLAAETLGEDGVTAGDILAFLPRAVKRDRDHPDGLAGISARPLVV